MQKSSILIIISALCLASTVSVSASSNDCEGVRGSLYLPHENDCDSYIDCTDGLGDTRKCPQGLLFNFEASTCQVPGDFPCYEKAPISSSYTL
ncbi:hypothetical protein BDF21DRAFT_489664 [Thamnidium elegans]|nr:hypothetical protein BDF21DRAFT_489664 [Thamnidium elegans]